MEAFKNKKNKKEENKVVIKIEDKFGTTNVVEWPTVSHGASLAVEAFQNNKG